MRVYANLSFMPAKFNKYFDNRESIIPILYKYNFKNVEGSLKEQHKAGLISFENKFRVLVGEQQSTSDAELNIKNLIALSSLLEKDLDDIKHKLVLTNSTLKTYSIPQTDANKVLLFLMLYTEPKKPSEYKFSMDENFNSPLRPDNLFDKVNALDKELNRLVVDDTTGEKQYYKCYSESIAKMDHFEELQIRITENAYKNLQESIIKQYSKVVSDANKTLQGLNILVDKFESVRGTEQYLNKLKELDSKPVIYSVRDSFNNVINRLETRLDSITE